jgi:xylulokinase
VILGLNLQTSKDEIIKAILEGITWEMKLNLELLKKAKVKVKELRAIGGGAKSKKWLQLKADMFGKKVLSLNVSESACLGTAILAGVGIGEYSSIDDAIKKIINVKKVFLPNIKNKKIYDEKFKIYCKIYPMIKELNLNI